MELRQLSERVFVLEGSTNIGIIRSSRGHAIIVDTGLDESTARKILRHCQELDLEPQVIMTTHAHADHFGGNAFLVKRTGAKVWASPFEAHTLAAPLLEPMGLYGGVLPPANLRNKFLLAPTSPVDVLLEPGRQVMDGLEGEVLLLAGHSPGQLGFGVDGVLFTADAFFPAEVLDKHKLPFLVDLGQTMATLKALAGTKWHTFVPGHGPVLTKVEPCLDYNLGRLQEIRQLVLSSLGEPRQVQEILSDILEHYGLLAEAPSIYHLDLAAVKAFLTHLADAGEIEMRVKGNRLVWQRLHS